MIEGIGKAYRPAVQDRLAYEGTGKDAGGHWPLWSTSPHTRPSEVSWYARSRSVRNKP